MTRLHNLTARFLKNESGAALVEYAPLLALIALVAIVILTSVGGKVSEKFSSIEASL
jgi:pilus assembly protein Flp/PilA